jgi:hypothetical protein
VILTLGIPAKRQAGPSKAEIATVPLFYQVQIRLGFSAALLAVSAAK